MLIAMDFSVTTFQFLGYPNRRYSYPSESANTHWCESSFLGTGTIGQRHYGSLVSPSC